MLTVLPILGIIGMNATVIGLSLTVIVAGFLVFIAIQLNQARPPRFDIEDYQTRWLKIKNSIKQSNEDSYKLAILEADKLLDRAMQECRVSGNTMGERLKRLAPRFSQVNAVWYAHKVRNQIAHDTDFAIEYTQATRVLQTFYKALKDLGAI